jgi:4-hydroxybenzoyl-CoA thioesterase
MFSHTRALQIEWGHCDPAGIVFNPRFFEFFDWNTALLLERALGVNKYEVLKKYGGAGIPLVETRAKFLAPCRYGDMVEITSTVARLGRSSFDVEHRLTNGGALAVEGFETRVWTGRDPDDPARIKAHAIPQEIVDRFKAAE